MNGKPDYRAVAGAAAIWLGLAAILFLAWKAASVLFIIFAGLLFAIIFNRSAEMLRKVLPLPHWATLMITYGVVALVIAGVAALAGTALILEFEELAAAVENQIEDLNSLLSRWGLGGKAGERTSVLEFLPGSLSPMETANGIIRSVFGALGNSLVVLFIAAFVAWNPAPYRSGLVSLFPKPKREKIDDAIRAATRDLSRWLKGQGLAMLTVFFTSWLTLWLIGMPYATALAVQAALLAFVQTIGPLIAGIVIILVGLSVGPVMALWGLGAYVVIQMVESNLTTPLIQREMSAIPPALALSCQLVFGALFGLIGLALAVPLLRVIMTLTSKLYVNDTLGGPSAGESPGS